VLRLGTTLCQSCGEDNSKEAQHHCRPQAVGKEDLICKDEREDFSELWVSKHDAEDAWWRDDPSTEKNEATHGKEQQFALEGFLLVDHDPDEIVDLSCAKKSQIISLDEAAQDETIDRAEAGDTEAHLEAVPPGEVTTPEGSKDQARLNDEGSCVKAASKRPRANFSAMLRAAAAARDVAKPS